MHNKKRQNSSGACAQTILELSSCKGGRSYAQSPYLRCMPIGIAHHQDEIIHLVQFPFPLLFQLHILTTKRKGEANSTWCLLIILLMRFPVKAEMGQVWRVTIALFILYPYPKLTLDED